MALGFIITVFRSDRTTVVAQWSTTWGSRCISGTHQFDGAVKAGHGRVLCNDGYPMSYEVTASAILPLEVHGNCSFVETSNIPGDEILYVEAWDMS